MRIPSELFLRPHISVLGSECLGALVRLWTAWIGDPRLLRRENLQLLSGMHEGWLTSTLHANLSLYFQQAEGQDHLVPRDLVDVAEKENKTRQVRAKAGQNGSKKRNGHTTEAASSQHQQTQTESKPVYSMTATPTVQVVEAKKNDLDGTPGHGVTADQAQEAIQRCRQGIIQRAWDREIKLYQAAQAPKVDPLEKAEMVANTSHPNTQEEISQIRHTAVTAFSNSPISPVSPEILDGGITNYDYCTTNRESVKKEIEEKEDRLVQAYKEGRLEEVACQANAEQMLPVAPEPKNPSLNNNIEKERENLSFSSSVFSSYSEEDEEKETKKDSLSLSLSSPEGGVGGDGSVTEDRGEVVEAERLEPHEMEAGSREERLALADEATRLAQYYIRKVRPVWPMTAYTVQVVSKAIEDVGVCRLLYQAADRYAQFCDDVGREPKYRKSPSQFFSKGVKHGYEDWMDQVSAHDPGLVSCDPDAD